MSDLVALIPAAGKGTRAYPYTREIPKGMLKVAGMPLVEHSLRLLRDQLGIRTFFIVVGSLGDVIREHLADGSRWGVRITYIQNNDLDLGMAHSVRLAGRHIQTPFVMVLSDEFYQDTNHSRLGEITLDGELGACGLFRTDDWASIRRNYTVQLRDARITAIEEKPRHPKEPILGTGTLLLSPRVFALIEKAFSHSATPPDFFTTLGQAVQDGHKMRPFFLEGRYVNVNDVDTLNWANFLGRAKLLADATHTVVVQAMGPEEGLQRVVTEFDRLACVDEVILVMPAGSVAPVWLQGLEKVRHLNCPPERQGYGGMIAWGLDHAQGDLLTVTEGDYSFYPGDVEKLLAYIADAELVLGTRTTRQLIQQGTRMRGIVRLSHVFLAKLIEVLWPNHSVRLTDVGCTFRTLWRHCYLDIRDQLHSLGPEYVLEMTLEVLKSRRRLIEVPISFLHTNPVLAAQHQRVGVFFGMLATVMQRRLGN
jgi:UDP-N-acetylglucosamine diphosphorylase / glucose-1-phosphate thymidylyltransferase / UDP-N-acetylgalactosamine diphosphorylase / glucosamine-1-phosphate N-acetyltransferase / galactosamine-1-phosphate N-acetyltransferase